MKMKNTKRNTLKPVFSSSDDFEKAIELFQSYQPVKVSRHLRDAFNDAIGRHFMNIGVNKWTATIYPQVKSYKFQRT